MRAVPVALGAFFALTMAGALAIGLAVATRGRRRELALLRALGSSSRDLSGSVRWHALTIVGIALLFGVPLGIAAGRTLYRLFARDLGVVPVPATSVGLVLAVCAAAIVIGLLAAARPGRAVADQRPAVVLRTE